MTEERPRTATGYKPEWLERSRRLCLELATVIGDFMERDVTVVGGLVPPLLIPRESLPNGADAHPGTMDVDVALSLALLDEERYRALSTRLRNAGLEADVTEGGNPTRQRWCATANDGEPITLEFVIAPSRPEDEPGTLRDLEPDFAAWIMEGMHLPFEDYRRPRSPVKGSAPMPFHGPIV